MTNAGPPPVADWTTTLPEAASTNAVAIDKFALTSAVSLLASTATTPANYDLRDAGANRLFGDADDVVYAVAPAFDSNTVLTFTIANGPLQPGRVRFSTKATLLDQNSNPLEVFTREFTIANPVLGQIENTDNNVLEGATPLVLTETPAGSGFSTVLAAGSFSTGTDSDYWRLHGEAGDHLPFAGDGRLGELALRGYPERARRRHRWELELLSQCRDQRFRFAGVRHFLSPSLFKPGTAGPLSIARGHLSRTAIRVRGQ